MSDFSYPDSLERPYLLLPDGLVIQRIHLRSYLYGFFHYHGECPRPKLLTESGKSIIVSDDLDYQTFTISRDGEVKVECKTETDHRPITVESFRTLIDPAVASKIIDLIVTTLFNAPNIVLICDGPSWEMTLTDTDGKKYRCSGCMWADPEYNGLKLSEQIRALLAPQFFVREYSIFDPSKMVLFDGLRDD